MKSRYDTKYQIEKSSGAMQLHERLEIRDYIHVFGKRIKETMTTPLTFGKGVFILGLSGIIFLSSPYYSVRFAPSEIQKIYQDGVTAGVDKANEQFSNDYIPKIIENAVEKTRKESLKDIDRIFGLKELGLSYKDLKEMEEQGLELKDYKIGPREKTISPKSKLKFPEDYT